jgi:hypothetical protein
MDDRENNIDNPHSIVENDGAEESPSKKFDHPPRDSNIPQRKLRQGKEATTSMSPEIARVNKRMASGQIPTCILRP